MHVYASCGFLKLHRLPASGTLLKNAPCVDEKTKGYNLRGSTQRAPRTQEGHDGAPRSVPSKVPIGSAAMKLYAPAFLAQISETQAQAGWMICGLMLALDVLK